MLRPYGLAGTHSRWDTLIGVALIPARSQGERRLDSRWRGNDDCCKGLRAGDDGWGVFS